MSANCFLQPSRNGSTGQVPVLKHWTFSRTVLGTTRALRGVPRRVLEKVQCSGTGTWPVERELQPLRGGCRKQLADMQPPLQPHFLAQYNSVFTNMWLSWNSHSLWPRELVLKKTPKNENSNLHGFELGPTLTLKLLYTIVVGRVHLVVFKYVQ